MVVSFLCYFFLFISLKKKKQREKLHSLSTFLTDWAPHKCSNCVLQLFPSLTTVTISLFLEFYQLIFFFRFLFLKNAFKPLSPRSTWLSLYHPSEPCWNVTFSVRCSPTVLAFLGKKLPHPCHILWGLNFPLICTLRKIIYQCYGVVSLYHDGDACLLSPSNWHILYTQNTFIYLFVCFWSLYNKISFMKSEIFISFVSCSIFSAIDNTWHVIGIWQIFIEWINKFINKEGKI